MILLMEEILQHLRLVLYPVIYRVLYVPGGSLGFLNPQQYHWDVFYFNWLYSWIFEDDSILMIL